MICTRLRSGHLSVHVGDGSRRIEEIVKNLELRLNAIIITTITIVLRWPACKDLQCCRSKGQSLVESCQ